MPGRIETTTKRGGDRSLSGCETSPVAGVPHSTVCLDIGGLLWYILPESNLPSIFHIMAPYPRGKGEVCKTFMHRFDSGRRLTARAADPH